MKTLIRSILLLGAAAVFSIGCERHNFSETQKLHKEHGAHGEHAEHHGDAKGKAVHDEKAKEGAHK